VSFHRHIRRINFRAVSTAVAGADVTPPEISATPFEEGDVSNDVIVVVFNEPIQAAGDDFLTGVTLMVNGNPETLTAAALQPDGITVHYTVLFTDEPDANDTITWEYDEPTGVIEDLAGNDLASVAAQPVTNDIGRHLRFNDAPNSMQIVTIGL
jgi:hypothetical protein